MHENTAIAAVEDLVAGDRKRVGFDGVDAGLAGARYAAARDPAAASLQSNGMFAAVGDLAIVDDYLGDAGELQQPAGIITERTILPVDDDVREFDVLDLLSAEEVATAGVDDARYAGNAGDARILPQYEIGSLVGAWWQENRCVLRRRLVDHLLQADALAVRRAWRWLVICRVNRAAQATIARCRKAARSHQRKGGCSRKTEQVTTGG